MTAAPQPVIFIHVRRQQGDRSGDHPGAGRSGRVRHRRRSGVERGAQSDVRRLPAPNRRRRSVQPDRPRRTRRGGAQTRTRRHPRQQRRRSHSTTRKLSRHHRRAMDALADRQSPRRCPHDPRRQSGSQQLLHSPVQGNLAARHPHQPDKPRAGLDGAVAGRWGSGADDCVRERHRPEGHRRAGRRRHGHREDSRRRRRSPTWLCSLPATVPQISPAKTSSSTAA